MIPGSDTYSIPSTTAVVVMPAPPAGTFRVLRYIQVYNPLSNASLDVELRFNNGTISGHIVTKTLGGGESLIVSGRAEDDAVLASACDKIVQLCADTTGKRVEAFASAAPATPLEVISAWGDFT